MPDQEREKYLKEISSLHAENATLKEEMALMQSQLDWLVSPQCSSDYLKNSENGKITPSRSE